MNLFIKLKHFSTPIKAIANSTRTYQRQISIINYRECVTLPTQLNKRRDSKRLGYKMNNNKPKVIIIGAGAAGIAAACRLYQEGITDIKVLEAEDRLGGRIHSVEYGGSVVDLGAQWCHGEKDNVVFDMVRDLDVLGDSFNDYHDNTYYESSGNVVDRSVTDELLEIAWSIFEDQDAMIMCDRPFGEYFIER